MIDLHIHTNCSDGVLSPEEVVDMAVGRGIRAIAVTDHDTIEGNKRAESAGALKNLPVLSGIEISAQWGSFSCHVLGYGIRLFTAEVKEAIQFLRENRIKRNEKIITNLKSLGIDICLEEVESEADGSIVGRPHFARTLVKKKVAGSVLEAFYLYLGAEAPAYVQKERLATADACRIIHLAGGLAVMAHPGQFEKSNPGKLENFVAHMAPLGLDGIEAHYSRHSLEQTRQYLRLAKKYNLIATGGSDYHRSGKYMPEMGFGMGNLRVPYSCYEAILKKLPRLG